MEHNGTLRVDVYRGAQLFLDGCRGGPPDTSPSTKSGDDKRCKGNHFGAWILIDVGLAGEVVGYMALNISTCLDYAMSSVMELFVT